MMTEAGSDATAGASVPSVTTVPLAGATPAIEMVMIAWSPETTLGGAVTEVIALRTIATELVRVTPLLDA